MEKKGAWIVVIILVVLGLLMAPTDTLAQAGKAEVIRWKGQCISASTVAPYGAFKHNQTGSWAMVYEWTEWLKKASGGRLLIDWAEPGAIVANSEIDKAVSKNVVQIAWSYGQYYAGRIPEGIIESGGLFLWETADQYYECLWKYGFAKAMQRVYDKFNIKYLPFPTNAICALGTNFPAPTPEAIAGKKIRAMAMFGDYIHMLKGSPVPTPWGELYMAMKLGTVDGWIAGIGAFEEQKMKEVTTGLVYPPNLSVTNTHMLINMDAFKALPQDLQRILDRDSIYVAYTAASHWNNQCMWVLRNSVEKYGVTIYPWPTKVVDRLTRQAFKEIYPRIAKKSKATAELIEIVKEQMRDYGRLE